MAGGNWQRGGGKGQRPRPVPRPKLPGAKPRRNPDELREWFRQYRRRLKARKGD